MDAELCNKDGKKPPLKNKQLQQAYACQDPLDILDKIFEPGEVVNISKAALSFAGYVDDSVKAVEELKN